MKINLNTIAMEIKELKAQLALHSSECKIRISGYVVTIQTNDIVLARTLSRRGYEVYVA